MSIPHDIRLPETRSFELDETGDIATVTDQDLIKQDIAVHLFNQTRPRRGEGITPTFIREFEKDVTDALKGCEYAEPPYTVNIEALGGSVVEINASTGNYEISINHEVR